MSHAYATLDAGAALQSGHGTGSTSALLLKVVDASLAGCVLVVPFLLGGRQALGQWALATLAAVAAVAWLLRESRAPRAIWRRSAGTSILLAGLAIVLMQLAPLPANVLAALSPHTGEILPLWQSGREGLGSWPQATLVPAATRGALCIFLAYSMLFVVTVQRVGRLEDVERILRWCAYAAITMAAFGLIQYVTANGKFFWIYEHPYSRTTDVAKGPFTCRNHFAHFLALGVGPMVWWIYQAIRQRSRRRSHRFGRTATEPSLAAPARVLALGVVLLAVLLSLSRGGAISTLSAALVALAVAAWFGAINARFAAGLVAAVLLVAGALAIVGHDSVTERLDTLTAGTVDAVDRLEGRRTIWRATAAAIPDFLPLGSGVGSLRHVYPMYLEEQNNPVYYTHAENGYLQTLLETGVPGLTLVVAGIGLCGYWCLSALRRADSPRTAVSVGAVAAALVASAVQSTVDFVWYVPGCMAVVAILAGCACRLSQITAGKSSRAAWRSEYPAAAALAAALGVAVVGVWMTVSRFGPVVAEPHWMGYLVLDRTTGGRSAGEEPATDAADAEAAHQATVTAQRTAISRLEEVLRWHPDHDEAHLRLAKAYLRLFGLLQQNSVNVMTLGDLRDAAIGSQFESREDFNRWLAAAVGEHWTMLVEARRHARQAVSLCPLEGIGYLLLADLAFLDGAEGDRGRNCVAQALKVRPHDGLVLMQAGIEAQRAGDLEGCLAYWKQAFQCGKAQRRRLMNLLGHCEPELYDEQIELYLAVFEPDLDGLRLFHERYKDRALPEQIAPLRERYRQALERELAGAGGPKAAGLWRELGLLSSALGDTAAAVRATEKALEFDPNDYTTRYALARRLMESGEFAAAHDQLLWCLRRRPDTPLVEKQLREVKVEIDRQRQMAAAPSGIERRY